MINGIDVSGKTPEQAGEYFAKQSLDRQVVLLEDGKEVLSHCHDGGRGGGGSV